ncbi:MAG: general secretion pathway protein GspB [Desulfuromonadaceae bacterium]|nr:general secretion pathway protein GspB [Desulfuromonadaceae bacterium]MDD2855218.1 general secretion pathway protein GspB [Desulfuromonadaceae bacterium]
MSSILKALKKLEDDKSARQPDELQINSEILRSDNPTKISSTAVILSSLLLLAGGSGGTYLYMKKAPSTDQSVTAELPAKPVSVRKEPKTVVPPVSTIKEEHPPAAIIIVPAKKEKTRDMLQLKSGRGDKISKKVIIPEPGKNNVETSGIPKAVTATTSTPQSVATQNKNVPTLRVNGIAFQDNSADTLAIVNGTPVAVGAKIDGVIVKDILKDRVIFKINENEFEIEMGQSNKH